MKKIISILLLIVSLQSRAQVLLNLQIPFSGVYIKSQLWNFSIINPGSQNISIKIEMTFSDAVNGQQIFTASSSVFTLNQQVTMLQAADFAPIVYNVVNSNYNIDTNPNGFLPVGQFDVCFAVMEIHAETTEKLTEQCEGIEVEPISPPLLIAPSDGEVTDYTKPLFTWVPPAPFANFNNLTYDWVLVEVTGNQNPSDAIEQNLPIYSEQGLTNNSLLYPPSLPDLDTSKVYAWQVGANSSNNAIAKSEIWTFKTRLYGLDTLYANTDAFYTALRKVNDASYITSTGIVRFEYMNEIKDSIAFINFYDLNSTSRSSLNAALMPVNLRFGQNFIRIDLGTLNGIVHGHIYLLELINNKNEKWYLKFEYRSSDNNN